MVGEFGFEVPEAPYLLEPIVEGYGEESSSEVRRVVGRVGGWVGW
jgi:hypothetical protein